MNIASLIKQLTELWLKIELFRKPTVLKDHPTRAMNPDQTRAERLHLSRTPLQYGRCLRPRPGTSRRRRTRPWPQHLSGEPISCWAMVADAPMNYYGVWAWWPKTPWFPIKFEYRVWTTHYLHWTYDMSSAWSCKPLYIGFDQRSVPTPATAYAINGNEWQANTSTIFNI